MQQFFDLRTPRDMFEKARREHARLQSECTIDNVFNFFVTVNHIADYASNAPNLHQVKLESFRKDQDLEDCRDLCNKGKHLRLTHKGRVDPTTAVRRLGALNTVPLNTMVLNGYQEIWLASCGGRPVDIFALADRALRKWDTFLTENGL